MFIDEFEKGVSDEEVVEGEKRVILTFDNDFSNLENSDVGVIRSTSSDRYEVILETVLDLVGSLENEKLDGTVIEVSPSSYR